jgi:ion channel-forming bestrophin family protein
VAWEGSQNFWNEAKSFWGEAIAWRGAVTPRVLPPVAVFGLIATVVYVISLYSPYLGIPVGPHEIAGALLGLLLVVRTNAGYERWWEARRLWGEIVNQTRSLATIALSYGPDDERWRQEVVRWTIVFAHVSRRVLRGEREMPEVVALLGPRPAARLAAAVHMPTAVSRRLGRLLRVAREGGVLDGTSFSAAESHRTALIGHVGNCERILATPLPRAYSIEIRRSIVMFLLTLTFALLSKDLGWAILPLTLLVAYTILSLDLIGSAMQNPFAPHSLGALPLDEICRGIERDLLGLLVEERGLVEDPDEILGLPVGAAGDGRPSPSPTGPPLQVPREARAASQDGTTGFESFSEG